VPDLANQLGAAVIDHPTIRGFMIPSTGYSEMVLRSYGRMPSILYIERALRLVSDAKECPHRDPEKQLFATPLPPRLGRDGDTLNKRLHLAALPGPCIEISNASPLGLLFYGRSPIRPTTAPLILTAKISFGVAIDAESIVKATEELVRSLLYELDVRNGVVVGTYTRPLPRDARARTRRRMPVTDRARYPETHIEHEVSDLFNFASQADDNLPLAFLSYYQTLEYFVPAAVRQSALKQIRRELRDPMFDKNSDNSLMRIVSAAERTVNISESGQFQTLVNECVRKDRLEEFFNQDWGNHFTKRGPIKSVGAINTHETSNLATEVADRIYQIRNRIVHAKGDPKYRDAAVLLPRSQEAEALRPDVELVRLLATEAILVGQGT
jgi:hypothetical protein